MDNPLFPDQPQVDYTPNPSPEQQNDLLGKWTNWLSSPENRAALMQLGVNLMQPIGVGQTPAGHFGEAAGAAMEARDRNIVAQDEMRRQGQQDQRAERELNISATNASANMLRAKKPFGEMTDYQSAQVAGKKEKDFQEFTKWALSFDNTDKSLQDAASRALRGEEAGKRQLRAAFDAMSSPQGSNSAPQVDDYSDQVQLPNGRWAVRRNGGWFYVPDGYTPASPTQ